MDNSREEQPRLSDPPAKSRQSAGRFAGELTSSLRAIEDLLCKVERHSRPAQKPPWYRRLSTWILTGVVGLVAANLFVLPESLTVQHLYALRKFQTTLDRYEQFIPDRCPEVTPKYEALRLETDRSDIEFATISYYLGICHQREATRAGADSATALENARAMFSDALETYRNPRASWGRRTAQVLGARQRATSDRRIETALRLAEVHRSLASFLSREENLLQAADLLKETLSSVKEEPEWRGALFDAWANVELERISFRIYSGEEAAETLLEVAHLHHDAAESLEGDSGQVSVARINEALDYAAMASFADRRLHLQKSAEILVDAFRRATDKGLVAHDQQSTPNFAVAYSGLGGAANRGGLRAGSGESVTRTIVSRPPARVDTIPWGFHLRSAQHTIAYRDRRLSKTLASVAALSPEDPHLESARAGIFLQDLVIVGTAHLQVSRFEFSRHHVSEGIRILEAALAYETEGRTCTARREVGEAVRYLAPERICAQPILTGISFEDPLRAMAHYNLALAWLQAASLEDGPSRIATALSLLDDSYLEGKVDPILLAHTAGVLHAVTAILVAEPEEVRANLGRSRDRFMEALRLLPEDEE